MLIQIVLAGALIVFFILAAVTTYWQAIIALPVSAAAFLGALSGAGGGLLAIILGALINAELNRRRDDRLRREEGRSLALTLHGEMLSVVNTYQRHMLVQSNSLNKLADHTDVTEWPVCTQSACSVAIFSKCSDRLGLLEDPDLIADLAQFYPTLPTEREFKTFAVESVPSICQNEIVNAEGAIKRATSIAKKLESVAARLAPPP